MLPHFTIEERDGRWYAETDWCVALTPSSSLTYNLQVTSGGRLATASAGWSSREKAQAAVEECKRRLR